MESSNGEGLYVSRYADRFKLTPVQGDLIRNALRDIGKSETWLSKKIGVSKAPFNWKMRGRISVFPKDGAIMYNVLGERPELEFLVNPEASNPSREELDSLRYAQRAFEITYFSSPAKKRLEMIENLVYSSSMPEDFDDSSLEE